MNNIKKWSFRLLGLCAGGVLMTLALTTGALVQAEETAAPASDDVMVYVAPDKEKQYFMSATDPGLKGAKQIVMMPLADAQALGFAAGGEAAKKVSTENAVVRGDATVSGGGSGPKFPSDAWRAELSKATKSTKEAEMVYVLVKRPDGSYTFVEKSLLSADISADKKPATNP